MLGYSKTIYMFTFVVTGLDFIRQSYTMTYKITEQNNMKIPAVNCFVVTTLDASILSCGRKCNSISECILFTITGKYYFWSVRSHFLFQDLLYNATI